MRAARTLGERAHRRSHWLAAVLLLTSIGAASVMVRQWPQKVSMAPPASHRIPQSQALVTARSVPIFDVAMLPHRDSVSEARAMAKPALLPPALADAAIAVVDAAAVEERAAHAPSPGIVETLPPLASRRLEIFATPGIAAEERELTIDPSAPSYTLVELPAVAVGRVVVVAGRGIKTGIRATSAAFRGILEKLPTSNSQFPTPASQLPNRSVRVGSWELEAGS